LAGGRGKAVLRTSGGEIRVDDVAGEVDASTSGGSIQIQRARGRVSAHTSGGNVSAFLSAQPNESCRLSTSGGNITVEVASSVHLDVDASTSGGGVSTDFPVVSASKDQQSLRASINGGGPLLQLRSSGGGIRIQKR
ncbi:MAG TPA: DUF4097 family beta strand repeat-containing protein, partial [Bryobacteraceae bacterium]|nr:DUF4097 family beta strand repeat-containing protein [Bryobacteraceae bacterium]